MRLSQIRVENFRRLEKVSISFENDNTVFVGPNNSGKTSAVVVIRSFLEKRDFKLHDFSSSVIALYDAFGEGEDVDVLPCIQLDLWFSVDPEKVSYGQAIQLATSISNEFSEIGIRCSLELKSSEGLMQKYNELFPVGEEGSKRRSLSHFLSLEGNLKEHFHITYSSLENTVSDPTVTPIDPSNGKKILKRFLRVDFVDAQRNIDDDNTSGSNKLSGAFASYYKHNLDQAENADSAIGIIDENNEKLSEHYEKSFKPLMEIIKGLGVPPVHDRKLKLVSSLSPQDALKGNTELFYNDPGDNHDLPEAYNGLGFKNLVFLAVQIDHYHRQWINTEEERPFCQVIFIEEPEVHLHVQVQQTFINNMWNLLKASSPEELDPPQLAITTHSPHILDATDFLKVRYFRRCESNIKSEPRRFDATAIYSLRDFELKQDDANIDFLRKYLKLTHCDLFFADAAILIEGTVERLLLPEMIKKTEPNLHANYLTTLEVGGAYASRFAGLLEFLHIPYLVITDIDSVDPENRKVCRADTEGAINSNSTLKSFFEDKPSITALNDLSSNANKQSNDNRYIAFQRSVTATIDKKEYSFYGRTLEETFVYENLKLFQNGTLNIGIKIPDDYKNIYEHVYTHIRKGSFKKTEFALNLLSSDVAWHTPVYISNGLEWLNKKLNSSDQNLDTSS